MEFTEGYMPFHGHKTYYKIYGTATPGKYPLVLLHGGPGCILSGNGEKHLKSAEARLC